MNPVDVYKNERDSVLCEDVSQKNRLKKTKKKKKKLTRQNKELLC